MPREQRKWLLRESMQMEMMELVQMMQMVKLEKLVHLRSSEQVVDHLQMEALTLVEVGAPQLQQTHLR